MRFVVPDTETTGLNPRKDRIVTIGAIALLNHEILIEDSFEAMLKAEYNSSAVKRPFHLDGRRSRLRGDA